MVFVEEKVEMNKRTYIADDSVSHRGLECQIGFALLWGHCIFSSVASGFLN